MDHDHLIAMLNRLKLTAIRDQLDILVDEAARRELTIREARSLFCEREIGRKDERRIEMSVGLARFPFVRDLDGFDFAAQPSIDRSKSARSLPAASLPMPRWCCCWGLPRLRHDAHLATSLKNKGALTGTFWLRAARASRAGIEPGQLGRGDCPGCALADLPRLDDAVTDQPEHRHLADGETPRRLFQR